ncbi:hypothetical protein BCV70DRAFT_87439 [Testicularia cyperi]|uniref:Uncharacterized protein n=1 Tax=Testicularia cyperi TaxID=1882483 RepID=A0A317XSY8_9BASI|nr:hypothetical protein BCV70DRAFT_87439 [Testicularia cyperi]
MTFMTVSHIRIPTLHPRRISSMILALTALHPAKSQFYLRSTVIATEPPISTMASSLSWPLALHSPFTEAVETSGLPHSLARL